MQWASDLDWGTVPEWLGALATGALALVALLALTRAQRDARRAEQRAEAVEAELVADRAERDRVRRAEYDREHVVTLLEVHGFTLVGHATGGLARRGRARAALARLPVDVLPLTNAYYSVERDDDPVGLPDPDAVEAELQAELQRLRAEALGR